MAVNLGRINALDDKRVPLQGQVPEPNGTKSSRQLSLFFPFRNRLIGRADFIGIVLHNAKRHRCEAMKMACKRAAG